MRLPDGYTIHTYTSFGYQLRFEDRHIALESAVVFGHRAAIRRLNKIARRHRRYGVIP